VAIDEGKQGVRKDALPAQGLVSVHAELTQTCEPGQTFPHSPQLFLSVPLFCKQQQQHSTHVTCPQ
jgi:hypothetical protein